MTTATLQLFDQFAEDLAKKVHNLAADQLKVMLTNTAPDQAGDAVAGDISEIAAGNGYSAGGTAITTTSCEQSGGTAPLVIADVTVVTASGGNVGPFRYAVIYNDTPTSPADPLIGYLDYGSSVTLGATESLTLDASAVNGILQIANA